MSKHNVKQHNFRHKKTKTKNKSTSYERGYIASLKAYLTSFLYFKYKQHTKRVDKNSRSVMVKEQTSRGYNPGAIIAESVRDYSNASFALTLFPAFGA
jgi:nucleoside 2-deoxyribosyltransferase